MIVERWEHKIKPGHLDEAKNLIFSIDWRRPFRLFESEIGVQYQLNAYVEYESMAEIEKFWNDIQPDPEYQSFLEKWQPLVISSERTFWRPIETSR
ncbi:MAG: NIPSNAP family protein [Desulfobacterales bacterium]|nr:NIPSNAP family protein [Desulfobacterales bacterium]